MSLLKILPAKAHRIVRDYWSGRWTGQVSLNFKDGKVLSIDTREHEVIDDAFCSVCFLPRPAGDMTWIVRKGKAYCGQCK